MKITLQKLRDRIASYGDAPINSLIALARIPSVAKKNDSEAAPFGEDVARARLRLLAKWPKKRAQPI